MKKWLLILLTLAVLLPVFAGCAQQSPESAELLPTAAPEPEPGNSDFLPEPEVSAEAAPEPYSFHTDRYAVSADAAAYLGDARTDYEALIDAVCAGEASVVTADRASAE
ncbi:MAG: hypothetical protein ACI4GO_02665, partial [Hominenteromicrobium sp.]